MTLNLTILNPNTDYGRYYCVSKNEIGITRGEIDVFGKLFIIVPCSDFQCFVPMFKKRSSFTKSPKVLMG